MNKVILMGRLVRDPEISCFNIDDICARFSLAVSYDSEHVDYINCVAFGKTAEIVENYLFKGNQALIEGRWQTGNYTKTDGQVVYTNTCNVSRIEFTGKKELTKSEESSGGNKEEKGQYSHYQGRRGK